jgi:hypothetical protein
MAEAECHLLRKELLELQTQAVAVVVVEKAHQLGLLAALAAPAS